LTDVLRHLADTHDQYPAELVVDDLARNWIPNPGTKNTCPG
jgi:hypothetical protein